MFHCLLFEGLSLEMGLRALHATNVVLYIYTHKHKKRIFKNNNTNRSLTIRILILVLVKPYGVINDLFCVFEGLTENTSIEESPKPTIPKHMWVSCSRFS